MEKPQIIKVSSLQIRPPIKRPEFVCEDLFRGFNNKDATRERKGKHPLFHDMKDLRTVHHWNLSLGRKPLGLNFFNFNPHVDPFSLNIGTEEDKGTEASRRGVAGFFFEGSHAELT